MLERIIPHDVFYPEDISMLRQVFYEYCEEHGFHPGSPASELIATNLISLFQLGHTTEEELLDAINGREHRRQTG